MPRCAFSGATELGGIAEGAPGEPGGDAPGSGTEDRKLWGYDEATGPVFCGAWPTQYGVQTTYGPGDYPTNDNNWDDRDLTLAAK